jgi:hypothetical protein
MRPADIRGALNSARWQLHTSVDRWSGGQAGKLIDELHWPQGRLVHLQELQELSRSLRKAADVLLETSSEVSPPQRPISPPLSACNR